MIKYVSEIMDENLLQVEPLDCVSCIKNLAMDKRINYFPVVENNKTIGVVTYKELIQAHPNRIAIDAMTQNYVNVNHEMSIWEVKSIFDDEQVDLLIVQNNLKPVGFVTRSLLDKEFGKHFDLLTGLPKTDFILYKAYELLKEGNEISVIFIDINNFGIIDKEYGHVFGDKILREIADLLKKNRPEETCLCRFGGDEFVVLTPFQVEVTKQVAEELLDTIAANTFGSGVNISISAGISGGRRISARVTDSYSMVLNLINIASLACSKAKMSTDKLCIEINPGSMDIA
ncbi:MAG: Diguanylate cyclase VdcA [Candidatus Dichloromethanomonas elyunquensis]|nr:MAG: Diguanylate cyclase VdcA [Candidatus Dichloromethanomonas elyunquensis]